MKKTPLIGLQKLLKVFIDHNRNMTRNDFIESLKIPMPGVPSGGNIRFNIVQESAAKNFESKTSFIIMSPRQTGRLLSIIANLIYELHFKYCKDTIVIARNINDARHFARRFSEILALNSHIYNIKTMSKKILNDIDQVVSLKTASMVQKLSKEERQGKRLIIIDAAYTEDSTPLYKLIDGWDTVIMETVPAPLDKFNSTFFKALIDFNGLALFNVIKHSYKEAGLNDTWVEQQKEAFGDTALFKREILLEWI